MRRVAFCLAILWLHVGAVFAQPFQADELPKMVSFVDDFATDSRDQYQTGGSIEWKTGDLTLKQNGWIRKEIATGRMLRVSADIDWLDEPDVDKTSIASIGFSFDNGRQVWIHITHARKFVKPNSSSGLANAKPAPVGNWTIKLSKWDWAPKQKDQKRKLVRKTVRTFSNVADLGNGVCSVSLQHGLIRVEDAKNQVAMRWYVHEANSTVNAVLLWAEQKDVAFRQLKMIGRAKLSLSSDQLEKIKKARELDAEIGKLIERKDYTKAAELRRQTIAIRRRVLGTGHPDYARDLNRLALIYFRAGDIKADETAAKKALSAHQWIYSDDHPRTALALSNLAYTYKEQRDYRRSEPLYRQAMTIRRNALGTKHSTYRDSRQSLANVLQLLAKEMENQDDFAAARRRRDEVLEIQKALYGELDWRATDARLALAYMKRLQTLRGEQRLRLREAEQAYVEGDRLNGIKKYVEAAAAFEKGLAIRKAILGDQHPQYSDGLNRLAVIYSRMPRYARSEFLSRKAQEINLRLFGDKHPRIARVAHNLGFYYSKLNDYDRATVRYRMAAEIYRTLGGEKDKDHLSTLGLLASALDAQANQLVRKAVFDSARKCRDEIIQIRIQLDGEQHWRVFDARWNLRHIDRLAEITAKQRQQLDRALELKQVANQSKDDNKLDEAVTNATSAAEITAAALGRKNRVYRNRMFELGNLHMRQQEHAAAESAFRAALENDDDLFGEIDGVHPDHGNALNALGRALEFPGDHRRAIPLYRDSANIYEKTNGLHGRNTEIVVDNLCRVLKRAADEDLANDAFTEARQIQQEILSLWSRRKSRDDWRVRDARFALTHIDQMESMDAEKRNQLNQARRDLRKAHDLSDEAKFEECIAICRGVLATRVRVLGLEHRDCAAAHIEVGDALDLSGDTSGAREHYEAALKIRIKAIGRDHPVTADSLDRLGSLLASVRDLKASEQHLKEALATRERLLGTGHADTRRSQSQLKKLREASADSQKYLPMSVMESALLRRGNKLMRRAQELSDEGKHAEAVKLQERLVHIYRRVFGHENAFELIPDSLETLADFRTQSGDLHGAEHAVREAVAVREKRQGKDHWETVKSRVELRELANLAALELEKRQELQQAETIERQAIELHKQGKVAESIKLMQQTIELRSKLLAKSHTRNAKALEWLGHRFAESDNSSAAETHFARALDVHKQLFGPEHPQVAHTLNKIGMFHQNRSNYAAARPFLERALAIREKTIGSDPNDSDAIETATSLNNLANLLLHLEDYALAEKLFRRALIIQQKQFGMDHVDTASTLNGLGQIFMKRGQLANARKCLEQTVTVFRKTYGTDHLKTAMALSNLGNLLSEIGEFERARTCLDESLEINRRLRGHGAPENLRTLNNLAHLLNKQGNVTLAESTLRDAVRASDRLNEGHPLRRVVRDNLIQFLQDVAQQDIARKDFDAARKRYDEALKLKRQLTRADHWQLTDIRLRRNHVDRLQRLDDEQRARLPDPDKIVIQTVELYQAGKHNEALQLADRSLQACEELLGPNCRETVICLGTLGTVLNLQGDQERAENCFQRAVEIGKRVMGERHPDYASALGMLGDIYKDKGQYRDAELRFRQAIEIKKNIDGTLRSADESNIKSLAEVLAALASESREQSEFDIARKHQKEALELQISRLGKTHWKVIDARQALTDIDLYAKFDVDTRKRLKDAERLKATVIELTRETKLKAAIPHAQQRLEIHLAVFGAKHPETAAAATTLGFVYERLQEFSKARSLFEQALAIREKALGVEHPKTGESLDSIAGVLRRMRHLQDALALQQRAVAISKKNYGPQNFETTTRLNNLALILEARGDKVAARKVYENIIAIRTKLLGSEHAYLITPLMNLGQLFSSSGDYPNARKYLNRALKLSRQSSKSENLKTALCLRHLGMLSKNDGDYSTARQQLEQSLSIQEKLLGDDHPTIGEAHRALGVLLRDMREYESAQSHLEQAIAINEAVYGRESRHTASCINNLGGLMRMIRNYKAAEALTKEAAELLKKALGPNHAETGAAVNSLGYLYQNMADYPKARKYYLESIEIDRKAWGLEHPMTAARMSLVAGRLRKMGYYPESRKLFEQALTILRKTRNADAPQLVDTLADFGMALYSMADYATAQRHLEEALVIRRRDQDSQLRDMAAICQRLAIVLEASGDRQGYIRYSKEALSIAERIWDSGNPQLIVYLNNYASGVESDDVAQQLRERALKILQSQLAKENPATAGTLLETAAQLRKLNRNEEAVKLYEQLLTTQIKKHGPDQPPVALVLRRMASVYSSMSRHEQSRKLYQEALAILESAFGPAPSTCGNRLDLANEYLALNEVDVAKELYSRAFEDLKEFYGSEHPFVAGRMDNAIGKLIEADAPEIALQFAKECLRIREAALGADHPDTVTNRLTVGQCLAITGKHSEAWTHISEGTRAFVRQVALKLAANPEQKHASYMGFRGYVVEVLFSLAEDAPKVAEERSRELLAILLDWKAMSGRSMMARQEALALEQDVEGLQLFEELKAVRQKLVQYQIRGEAGRNQQQFDTLTDRQATLERKLAGRVKDYALLRRSAEAGPDSITAHLPPNSAMVEFVKFRHYDFAASKGGIWQASSSRYAAIIYQAIPRKTWMTDFEKAEAESKRLGKPLLVHFSAKWAGPSIAFDRDVLDTPEFQDLLEQFIAVRIDIDDNPEIAKRFGIKAIPSDVYLSSKGKVLGRLQGLRKKDKYLKSIRTTFGLSPQGVAPRFVVLGDAEPIEEAIYAWRRSIQTGSVNAKAESLLRERLWNPLKGSLFKGANRLFLALDGQLALVPFEAIRLEDGRYLVEQFHVSYLSNGRDMMPRLKPMGKPGPAVIISDPDYNAFAGEQSAAADTLLASAGQQRSSEVTTRGLRFDSLPGFSREAKAVADAWHRYRPNESLQFIKGSQANEDNLNQLSRPRILHFVTHGFFFPDLNRLKTSPGKNSETSSRPSANPTDRGFSPSRPTEVVPTARRYEDPRLRSGLALAGANQWLRRSEIGHSDGLLTALEVENLNLWGTELVVLSACETGLGHVQVGEGVLGLRRAFRQAGAQTVLSSLWKVPDSETEQLMTRFFELWLTGTPKSEALRVSQLELIARLRGETDPRRRLAHPLYWGGFICHGSPK